LLNCKIKKAEKLETGANTCQPQTEGYIILDIQKMTIEEKMQAMELLWEDFASMRLTFNLRIGMKTF
jgi:hypothetical protein